MTLITLQLSPPTLQTARNHAIPPPYPGRSGTRDGSSRRRHRSLRTQQSRGLALAGTVGIHRYCFRVTYLVCVAGFSWFYSVLKSACEDVFVGDKKWGKEGQVIP